MDGLIRCGKCKRELDPEQYPPSQRHNGGYCRECKRAYERSKKRPPLANCARCGKVRTGSHRAYCVECMQQYRQERQTRPCARCGAERDPSESQVSDAYCNECARAYHRSRHAENGRRITPICSMCGIERDDQVHQAYCPNCLYSWHIKRKYGLTLDEYVAMLERQGGGCSICGVRQSQLWREVVRQPLVIDHCHNSNKVRGLLCDHCNRGLGQFRDDPALLRRAAEYLEAHASS